MAAIVIDSPGWREGWGDAQRDGRDDVRHAPNLRLVCDGICRVDEQVYRRRRLVVVVLVGLLLAIALAGASMSLTRPSTAGAVPQGRQTHVVHAGETYWSIAADRHGSGDLRVEVAQLVDANGGRPLFPGDRIELP